MASPMVGNATASDVHRHRHDLKRVAHMMPRPAADHGHASHRLQRHGKDQQPQHEEAERQAHRDIVSH